MYFYYVELLKLKKKYFVSICLVHEFHKPLEGFIVLKGAILFIYYSVFEVKKILVTEKGYSSLVQKEKD